MTRIQAIVLLVALMFPGMSARGQVPQTAAKPPGVFESTQVLSLRLVTDMKTLMDDRDSLKATSHPATLTFLEADGRTGSIDVELKTRGHWRRQKKNCDFAPIKVDFPKAKSQPEGSIFAGQGDLKLVTHCRTKDNSFEQYVMREYLVYRLYNLLTPISFRARLARTTYVDAAAKVDSVTRYSFVIEEEKNFADRTGTSLLESKGARFEDLDPDGAATMSAFQYLIGGTDWSLVALHNIVLTQNKESGSVLPVPYDFDWSGIVNTKYSFPDYRLPIKTVRQRIYRGICRNPEQWGPVLQRFRDQKTALYAVYDSLPDLDPKYAKETREYLEGFYQVIEKPGSLKSELINTCREA